MIAIDTSSIVAYLSGSSGADVEKIEEALDRKILVLPPVVLAELLSDPSLSKKAIESICALPVLEITDQKYWQRVGIMRSKLIAKKLKSRLADSLIAQICIDYDIPLVTRDKDFAHFKKYFSLKLWSKD